MLSPGVISTSSSATRQISPMMQVMRSSL
ncbi:MAG: hypothetical protein QOK40_173, partial [Miltoncostaeaceae bacterium]|nr:hypothetical protein [Miltoncostaeaceae bacterium]